MCQVSTVACTGSDAVVDDVGEDPGEPHDAPEELELGPDGLLLEISLKVNLSMSLGKNDDHYVPLESLTENGFEVTQLLALPGGSRAVTI